MNIKLPDGRYIVAVSGGVDSMVLLDLLCKQQGVEIIVAHFNHGIRKNSYSDEDFVRRQAATRGLVFVSGQGSLGENASEADARLARYAFLSDVKERYEAAAIVTAHHQDDLIETAFINIIRGTGPRGVIAIESNKNIIRPLLRYPKQSILDYARQHNLSWVEDDSNQDNKYLRNYIRHNLTSVMGEKERRRLLEQIAVVKRAYREIAEITATISQKILINDTTLDRSAFIDLPHEVATTFLSGWLTRQGVKELDRRTIERLTNAIKTAGPASRHAVKHGRTIVLSKEEAALI